MRLSQIDSSSESPRTYFYVFVDSSRHREQSASPDQSQAEPVEGSAHEAQSSRDSIVSSAFERFARNYASEAQVNINPNKYHDIRKAFGVQKLPAFGVSDLDLSSLDALYPEPQNLPSVWNPVGFRERNRILNSGKFLPKVERAIISLYSTADSLYNFIRDLHLKNLDEGLSGVAQEVEDEVLAIRGKKFLDAISLGRKVFLPW